MERNLTAVFETIKAIFDFDVVRRLFFFGGVAASIIIGVSLYKWIQEPIYQPLPYSVSEQNFSSIINTLEKANIQYKINERNGIISVPSNEINTAKIKLSSAGISKDDGFTFAFLNEQNKLGTSQFLETARFLRALEADLAKTISAIQGISHAKVNIAIPQNNIFADENSITKASIVISVAPGYDNNREKIRAIIQLVAASVPELDPKNIAITDQYGHYLSSIIDQSSILNQEQLNYQNSIQHYYEKRIQALITPIVGENKFSINVHANIDFTQQEQANEEYDPDGKAIRSEQSIAEKNNTTPPSGVPGAASNQGEGVQQGPGAQAAGHSRDENVKNYEVSRTMKYTKSASPVIKTIAAAVIVDDEAVYDPETQKMTAHPVAEDKIKKITELVKSTIGYDETRGDRVTVINSAFVPNEIKPAPNLNVWDQPWFWEWVKRIGGIIAGFAFLVIIYRELLSELKVDDSKKTALKKLDPNAVMVTPEMIKLKNEQIEILKDMASRDPNKVAHIIKKWVTK